MVFPPVPAARLRAVPVLFDKRSIPDGEYDKGDFEGWLDKISKIDYTTNRKSVGRQTASSLPADQKNDRQRVLNVGRSFLLSIFILSFRDLPGNIKHTENDRKDQAQQTDDDCQKCEKFRQCHATSPLSAQDLRGRKLSKVPTRGPVSCETDFRARSQPPAFFDTALLPPFLATTPV